jgi:CRISPR-associated protein Cas2
VQYSVFECEVDPAQWTALRARLIGEIDTDCDSLRFYRPGTEGRKRIEQVSEKAALEFFLIDDKRRGPSSTVQKPCRLAG